MFIIKATRQWGTISQYLIQGQTPRILDSDKRWIFRRNLVSYETPNYTKELAERLVALWNEEDSPTWVYKVTHVLFI